MRARTLLSAAALLASAACSSLPAPTTVATPAVTRGEAPALAVWTPASDGSSPGSGLSGVTYFSSDRDAYAAAFAVSRDGRLRVVWPESPSDDGLVAGGRTYRANGNFAQYGSYLGGARNAVPYVFVLLSEQRFDLTRFGAGSKWKYQVNLEDLGRVAEDAIETVASMVLPSPEAGYSADYAFIGPRLTGQAQMLSMYCGVRNMDARNYAYFRDLWATFDPWDSSLGAVSFATGWNFWPGAFFPISGRGSGMAFYADRASRATAAFWGGCPMLTPFQQVRPFNLAYANFATQGGIIEGPTPGNPTPFDTASTGDQPGDKLKVKPSEIFGGPGAAIAGGTHDAAAERRARLRERIETRRDERVARGSEGRAAFRTEQLTGLDLARLERRARQQELAELGLTRPVNGGIDRSGAARGGRIGSDPAFGRGSGASGAASRGRSAGARGTATSDGFGAPSAGRSAARGDAGASGAGASGAGAGSAGAAARGAGGESRGSGGGESGGGGSRSRTP